jgi:hypothetical protein
MAVTLVAAVVSPLGVRAQLLYNGGGTGQINFSGQPVAVYGGANPLGIFDAYTGNNDILSSPGGGFNEINYVNPYIAQTGVQPLGVIATLNPGNYIVPGSASPAFPNPVPFGGGTIAIGPAFGAFSIGEVAPGFVSEGDSEQTATFTVGALGLPLTLGTYLAINGTLNPNSAVAASLVTYITDTTTGWSVALEEVLGATGLNSPATQALSGSFPAPAALNAWMAYGPLDATYTGLAAASVDSAYFNGGPANLALANPLPVNVGDQFTIVSVLTEAADPDATIDSDPAPALLDGVTLPDDVVYDTQVPEPAALSLVAVGLSVLLVFRKRSRA